MLSLILKELFCNRYKLFSNLFENVSIQKLINFLMYDNYISYNCTLILSVVFYLGAEVCFLRQPLQSRHITTCSWVLPKYTNINLNINLLGISEHFPEESAKPGLHKGCG